MNNISYDYKNRKGIKEISWKDFGKFSKKLSELLSKEKIDIIIGIARAGLLPATAVSCMLRKEIYPIRLTRRFNDEFVTKNPKWKLTLPKNILRNKVVAIIDEITDTGKTLSIVKEETKKCGASRVVTASLISHTWAKPKPDYVIFETDELVLFPWDFKIFQEGQWQIHPEYKNAILKQQGNLR